MQVQYSFALLTYALRSLSFRDISELQKKWALHTVLLHADIITSRLQQKQQDGRSVVTLKPPPSSLLNGTGDPVAKRGEALPDTWSAQDDGYPSYRPLLCFAFLYYLSVCIGEVFYHHLSFQTAYSSALQLMSRPLPAALVYRYPPHCLPLSRASSCAPHSALLSALCPLPSALCPALTCAQQGRRAVHEQCIQGAEAGAAC